VKACTACRRAHHYPRPICPFCGSNRTEWKDSAGRGVIYSYSVMRRATPPYVLAYVTLDEGPTMMTNLVDCDFDALRIGQPVRVVWTPTDGGPAGPHVHPAVVLPFLSAALGPRHHPMPGLAARHEVDSPSGLIRLVRLEALTPALRLTRLCSIFPTATKAGLQLVGLDLMRRPRPVVSVPLVGIGGITTDNGPAVVGAGAVAVAVIPAICATPDPEIATRRFLERITAADAGGASAS
jgi:hypothetical protein